MVRALMLTTTLLLLSAKGSAVAAMITFDERPFQPVNGLSLGGVAFNFTVDGAEQKAMS